MIKQPRILIYEDEEDIAFILRKRLLTEGYMVKWNETARNFHQEVKDFQPDLVILDILLPDITGWQVCAGIRGLLDEERSRTRILLVSALGEETDILRGLENGADDYIVKPLRLREVLARVNALLRRDRTSPNKTEKSEGVIVLDQLVVNPTSFQAFLNSKPLPLTFAEFQILLTLTTHPSQVISRVQLNQRIHPNDVSFSGSSTDQNLRNIDVHIRSLRLKLGPMRDWLYTMRGSGYVFRDPKSDSLNERFKLSPE